MNGEPNYVYIVLSATPYRMGRWIRRATGEAYNHVSIATEESLTTLYSFARRYYRTPFHGGFVTETPDRYHHKGLSSHIRLYRLPVEAVLYPCGLCLALGCVPALAENIKHERVYVVAAPDGAIQSLTDSVRATHALTESRLSGEMPVLLVVYLFASMAEERFARAFTLGVLTETIDSGRWREPVACAGSALMLFLTTGAFRLGVVGSINVLAFGALCALLHMRGWAGCALGLRFAWSWATASSS